MKTKNTRTVSLMAAVMMLALAGPVTAADRGAHNMPPPSGHGAPGNVDHAAHAGRQIATSTVQGYMLTYHLLDMKERAEMMKGMEGHTMAGMSDSPDITNHLMVYIQGADGSLASGKVGFQVIGPDGKDFKTMTMGMYGGYGADVSLKAKGAYKVKTKAVVGSATLTDEFTYQVE